jgi:hypothetical protein
MVAAIETIVDSVDLEKSGDTFGDVSDSSSAGAAEPVLLSETGNLRDAAFAEAVLRRGESPAQFGEKCGRARPLAGRQLADSETAGLGARMCVHRACAVREDSNLERRPAVLSQLALGSANGVVNVHEGGFTLVSLEIARSGSLHALLRRDEHVPV